MPTLLAVDRLSRRFGAFWALRDASFSVHSGEILGLIGPNGSGKTTLFQCLAGLLPATRGSVTVEGQLVEPADRKRHLYFVPDGITPWAEQPVEWVLRFAAGLHGTRPAAQREIVAELGLEPLLRSRLESLSKGEHRRVMLALGLLAPQPLLLLDEPFDGLDLRQTREVMTVLRQRAARGRTLFLSIHQLGDAERICDRLVLLSGGRVVGEGTLPELRQQAGLAPATASQRGAPGTAAVGEHGLEEVFLALT